MSPGGEKFRRVKRNDFCPYPECTWAGLSTHFHCLVCSSFHTNKVCHYMFCSSQDFKALVTKPSEKKFSSFVLIII